MKVGTSGVIRSLRAIYDYVVFYEFKLAQSRVKLALFAILYVGAVIAGFLYSERHWLIPWLSILVFISPALSYGLKKYRADTVPKPKFQKNEALQEAINTAQPTPTEAKMGFETLRSTRRNKVLFESSICVSRDFNRDFMFNADVDWTLIKEESSPEYDRLIAHLRRHSDLFVTFGRGKLFESISRGKAMINETKIAFKSHFPPRNGETELSIYKTDYFTGLCSAERSLDDACAIDAQGNEAVLSPSSERQPFNPKGRSYLLPDFVDNPVPVSQQFGIEIIGLTRDKIFRVPFQSTKVEFSKGKRIPLATGSMDWEDAQVATTLKDLVVRAAKRELIEEWGGRPGAAGKDLRKRLEQSTYVPMGYYRQVVRAGKPQFVCLVFLDCLDSELFADQSEVLVDLSEDNRGPLLTPKLSEKITSLDVLERRIKHVLNVTSPKGDSVALFGAAQCLLHAIEDNPDRVKSVLELE